MWLSLSMTILLKSCRWGSIPPTIIPYFSTSLKPGVVFLVPAIVPFHPLSLAASRNLRDLTSATVSLIKYVSLTQRRSHYILLECSRRLVHLVVTALPYHGRWRLWSWYLEERPIPRALTILPYLSAPIAR
jgi:hypothetical protein